jgi:RNA polymerase sigma-70 factor (ECF subfamily)
MPITPDAWNWESARRRCLGEARRHARTEADAQDAVQAAMLQAWRSRSSCNAPEDPLPWMLAITRREAWRLRPRGFQVELESSGYGDCASFDDAERIVERLDMQAAIAELDKEQRHLLHLRYTEDLAHHSVAQRLGIPEGTAKVRLHRVRNRLRALLEPA